MKNGNREEAQEARVSVGGVRRAGVGVEREGGGTGRKKVAL